MKNLETWFAGRQSASERAFGAWLTPALLMALLSGFSDVQADSGRADQTAIRNADTAAGFETKFQEAIDFFREKTTVPPDVFAGLEATAKARAFSVSGMTNRYALDTIRESLQTAIEGGTTANEWLTKLEEEFGKLGLSGVDDRAYHMRLVFRQNAYTAYGAGRYRQMELLKKERPYWQYVTIGDDHVRPEHAALDGMIRPADDPIWKNVYPPWGFNCRCMVVSVSQDEMDDEGLSITPKESLFIAPPPEGFGTDPAEAFGLKGTA